MRSLPFLFLISLVSISFAMSDKEKLVAKAEDIKKTTVQDTAKIEGIKFYTQKNSYLKGEEVCFIFENSSKTDILLPSAAPFAIFEKTKPEVAIYSPVSAQVITNVKPNEKKQWCWNQKDQEGKEVSSGDYFARITFFDKSGNKYFLKSEFSLKIK
ncbi:MAG: hypothetical protein ACP5P7_04235 [Sulfurihydrogenibium sp.]